MADRPSSAAPKRRAYLPGAERRRLIIEAAQKVFARDNLMGARTRDIAEAAAVNQATIFEHFDSKEHLFDAAVVQPLIDAMQGMDARVELYRQADGPDALGRLATESAQRNLERMVEIFPLLVAALFSEPELGRRLYREQVAPLIRRRGQALAPVVKDGLDPQFVGLAHFGMLFAAAMDRWLGDPDDPLPVSAPQITRLSATGFAKSKDEPTG